MIVSEAVQKEAAGLFEVDSASLHSIGGTDGAVYSCRKGSRAFVMKFVPVAGDGVSVYEEKLAFIGYLAEHGVPIAAPVQSNRGNRFEVVAGEETTYLVTLAPRADGRNPTARNLYDWNERLFRTWGEVVGKMHALARQYPRWERPSAEAIAAGTAEPTRINDWEGEHRYFAGWCKEPKIVQHWLPLYDELKYLPRDRASYGLIHNDLHQYNFMYNPEARGGSPITIIDFDVCGYHWFITDIAIALYHATSESARGGLPARREFARGFLTPFRQGYQQENDLDETWFLYMPTFLKYREILVYIALSETWNPESRNRWQTSFLAEKRRRILRDEPVL